MAQQVIRAFCGTLALMAASCSHSSWGDVVSTHEAASQLVLTTAAAGAASGAAFTTQPVVAVRDSAGNTVTTDNATVVTMTVSAGGTVVGTATRTAVSGVATFVNVGISGTAGTAYTLTFSSGSLTPATQSITPTAGAASQLVLTTAAAGAASGAAFTTQPVVAVRDAAGITVTTDNTTVVTMTVSAGGTVVGTASRTAVSGVATFTNVGISGTAGTAYTLTFSSGSLTPATQSITPTAGAASRLVLTTPAAGAASGAAFTTQPVVAVRDAAGNMVTTDNATVVTMTVSAGGTVVGTATRTAVSGVATFVNVGISGTAGTAYTLTFSGGSLTPATQSITPTAGAASQLVLTTPAAGAASGAAFTTQPVVAVRDAAGNTVTTDNATVVTMTVSAGGTVVGTATRTAVSGVATFVNVGISGTAGTAYTLTFSSGLLTPATQSITVQTGTVTPVFQDGFETYPNEATVGLASAITLGHTENGYSWNDSFGNSGDGYPGTIIGVGANGKFTRSSDYWTDGDSASGTLLNYTGLTVNILGADWKPIAGSPFTITSNTSTVLNFAGDATPGVYIESCRPRVSNEMAHSGSQSLKMPFGPSPPSVIIGSGWSDSRSEQRFGFGAYLTEGWIEYWLYVPTNYYHRSESATDYTNNKFLILWNNIYGTHEANLWGIQTIPRPLYTSSNSSDFFYYAMTSDFVSTNETEHNTTTMFISPTGPIRTGTWNRIRVHFKASSGPLVQDGVWQVYVYNATDGSTTILDVTGNFYPKNPANPSSGNGGLGVNSGYLLGAANSGYTLRTTFYVDDFKIYNVNPGW